MFATFLAHFIFDAPWKAKSVLAALATLVVGTGLWVKTALDSHSNTAIPQTTSSVSATSKPDIQEQAANPSEQSPWKKPLPGYVHISASYLGGFLIGWLSRRILKLAAICTAIALSGLAWVHHLGFDTTHAQAVVERDSKWVQHEIVQTRDYLEGLLPSVTTGGLGAFFGFRRKNNYLPIGDLKN